MQGSLCFGSLLVAALHVLQLVRKMLNARNPANSLMAAKHGAGFLGHVLDTFNDFAYVQIAIYGTPYRESAKATYKLMHKMGITPVLGIVIIVSGVCFLGCALGGGLAAAVGIAIAEWSGVAPLISTVR